MAGYPAKDPQYIPRESPETRRGQPLSKSIPGRFTATGRYNEQGGRVGSRTRLKRTH